MSPTFSPPVPSFVHTAMLFFGSTLSSNGILYLTSTISEGTSRAAGNFICAVRCGGCPKQRRCQTFWAELSNLHRKFHTVHLLLLTKHFISSRTRKGYTQLERSIAAHPQDMLRSPTTFRGRADETRRRRNKKDTYEFAQHDLGL